MNPFRSPLLSLAALTTCVGLIVCAACSDDTTDPNSAPATGGSAGSGAGTGGTSAGTPSGGSAGTSAGGTAGAAGAATKPVYALSTLLNAGDSTTSTSLLITTSSLDDGPTLDISKGIEVAGTASLFGIEGKGTFFAFPNNTPVMTRYDVDTEGVITKQGELSFQNFGVGQANSTRSVVFLSDTKAYVLDDTTLQAIVWNPAEGVTTGQVIDLSAMKSDTAGVTTFFSYDPKRRGDQIVVLGYYFDSQFNPFTGSSVAFIDTTNDTATVVKDTRCDIPSTSVLTASGDLYFASDPYVGAVHRIDATKKDGCVTRIKQGTNAFDTSFLLTVGDVTSGAPGGGIIAGDGNSVYVRAFDESVFPVGSTTTQFDLSAAAAWRWWKVDLSNPSAPATKSALDPAAGDLKTFRVDDQAYAIECTANYATSTLAHMNAPGAPVKGANMKGYTSGIVRVH